MNITSIGTTNKILLVFLAALGLAVLKLLDFIFVPLMFAIFLSLAFAPILRWGIKKKLPKYLSLVVVIVVLVAIVFIFWELTKVSGQEILQNRTEMLQKLDTKVGGLISEYIADANVANGKEMIENFAQQNISSELLIQKLGVVLTYVKNFFTTLAITLLFLILILAGSVNFRVLLQETLFNQPRQISKILVTIERSISRFLLVKFATSFITGVLVMIASWAFGLSMPLVWGILAFLFNFVQMFGSIIITIFISLMSLIEIDSTGLVIAAIVTFIAIQIVVGSVVEPILMGKSFQINIVMVLIMLMFWGFLWGISGMVLAIPMAVLLKTLLEQIPTTRGIAKIMS